MTLTLAATKENVEAVRCRRVLGCLCGKPVVGPCPFCAVERALIDGGKKGLGPKDPLFPGHDGRAVSRRRAVATLRAVTGLPAVREHSLRQAGAKMYARRGLSVPLVQFLARWGGPVVARYVGDALNGQLAAAVSAAGPGGPVFSYQSLRDDVLAALRRSGELERHSAPSGLGPAPLADSLAALPPAPGGPPGGPIFQGETVQGLRPGGKSFHGHCHEVVCADPSLPPDVWVTRCGWRFGASRHIRMLIDGAPVTCPKCLQFRARGGGAVAPRPADVYCPDGLGAPA